LPEELEPVKSPLEHQHVQSAQHHKTFIINTEYSPCYSSQHDSLSKILFSQYNKSKSVLVAAQMGRLIKATSNNKQENYLCYGPDAVLPLFSSKRIHSRSASLARSNSV